MGAAPALVATPVSTPAGVEKSLDTARTSACATSFAVRRESACATHLCHGLSGQEFRVALVALADMLFQPVLNEVQ